MKKHTACAFSALLAVGCASTSSPYVGGDERFESTDRTGSFDEREHILDLISVETAPEDNLKFVSPNNLFGFYTRLDISTAEPRNFQSAAFSPELTYKQRAWWKRFFVGKQVEKAFEIKVNIKSQGDDIPFRKSIFNIDYTSNRQQGEVWTRKNLFSAIEDKYVRIDPETVISTDFGISYTDEISSQAINVALDTVSRAATLVDASALVTTLTKPKLKEFSNFADETVSQLFAKEITENLVVEFPLTALKSDTAVTVTAYLPDLKSGRRKVVGAWKVRMHPPKVSMFSDLHICLPDQVTSSGSSGEFSIEDDAPGVSNCAYVGEGGDRQTAITRAYSVVSAPQVLAFNVSESQTLRQYIEGQYRSDIEVLNRKPDENDAADAAEDRTFDGSKFCSAVAYELQTLGFNYYDSIVGLWAVVNSGQLRPKTVDLLFGATAAEEGACEDIAYDLEALNLIHGDKNRMLKINYMESGTAKPADKAGNF